MRRNNNLLFITVLISFFFMGVLNLFGQKQGFAAKLKEAITAMEKEADKDPDTFKANIERLDKEWSGRKDAVEQSVVHVMLASAYKEMRWTYITDFDEETRGGYQQKMSEHISHVMDDMEALADANADDYGVFLSRGKDSELYNHDMLSVMLRYVKEEASLASHDLADLEERVLNVYQKRGNLNAYAHVKMEWLNCKRNVAKKYGRLTDEQYKDSLYQLLQQVKGEEVGADVALAYQEQIDGTDERITFLKWAMKEVAKSRKKDDLKRALNHALQPTVSTSYQDHILADRPGKVRLNYWNCDRATLTVRQYAGRRTDKNHQGELILTGAVVAKQDVVFEMDSVNAERTAQGLPVKGWVETEFTLPVGHYVCVAEGVGDMGATEFYVSTVHLMVTELNKETFRVYVVDNETGRPIQGVKVQARKKMPETSEKTKGWEDRNLDAELLTGADGTVDVGKDMWIRAVRTERDHTNYTRAYGTWRTYEERNPVVSLRIMTDRSLYRPGQKVQGTVVVYTQKDDDVRVVDGDKLMLKAWDAKHNKIAEVELVTNEYGSASFEFMLPELCEVGSMSLSVESETGSSGSEQVRVEEYKRPTFDVSIKGPWGGKFGQTIEAVGTAMMLAGVPVQGAQVHYTVECSSGPFCWWRYGSNSWNTVAEGDLVTDDEGQFRVPILLTDEYLSNDYELMRYRVKAQVTDVSGESHEAGWSTSVGNQTVAPYVSVKSVVDLAKDETFKVEVFNANHEKVEMNGTYQIGRGDQVFAEGTFTAGEEVLLPKALQLGVNYTVVATVVDSLGKEVRDYGRFTPYRSDLPVTDFGKLGTAEKRRAAGQLIEQNLLYSDTNTFVEGGAVDLYLTTEETDAYIIYNVYSVDALLESHAAVTDGAMKHLRLQHRKEWGEGIRVSIMYVRNGHFVSLDRSFELARPEKRLKLEWATFRDNLQPGQQEQWTLTITDKNGKRVSGAEMMAVLYDAALDRIYSHYWSFYLGFSRRTPNVRCTDVTNTSFPSFWLKGELPSIKTYIREYDFFKGFEHDRFTRGHRMLLRKNAMYSAGAPMLGAVVEDGMVADVEESVVLNEVPLAKAMDTAAEEVETKEDFENATIRENFAETAFFLPHLVSDKKGNVSIQFTLPESLTEWQFMGLAHTKDVDYGTIRATAVAKKVFMLRPNMPRFVRWGDKAVVASSVINQSEEALKGAVRMRLLNPETDEVVLTMEKPFAVEAGKTVGVEFGFDVKEEWEDLDCEIIAVSGHVSDGEKNPLPVLSTKQEIVESVPYYIMGNADGAEVTKTIDLTKLFNQNSGTATHRVMKVEYTDNPAWMCIEALRSVKNPTEDNAADYATSLYANTRMVELMRTFPLLEKHESRAELTQRVATAEKKLAGLQQVDGGWSWFKGMSSNYYITMAVCEQLAKLPAPAEQVKKMLKEGMEYLDRHELESYKRYKQYGKIWPSNSELRYLYLSAQMPERTVSKEVEKMREEYLKLVEKEPRDLTIYGVANAAFSLRAFGHVKSADKFVDFLKDYTVEKPGQGRFYATDAAYYSWMDYRIPTQIAAMNAIRQKDKKDAYLNDMQLWLISQKQVQKWDNPMNTIEVADFLLRISPMETFHETKNPVLCVDGQQLKDMDYGTINTERDKLEGRESNLVLQGNVLADVPESVLKDGVQQLEVKKQTPSISWGAAYATFMEEVDNLNAYATDELKVQRKLYVQSAGSDKWEDYQQGQVLTVGDKLKIRHIITADRDMDFVRVAAQHPACLEPMRHMSGYQWMGGRGCYLSIHDSRFDMFFDWFTRGTTTMDMEYYVVRAGTYEAGISTVECMYAKQFGGHTDGLRVNVKSDK